MTYCCEKLAVPKIVWLGIWPSEFQFNENLLKSLSEKDEAKLKSFETRPYLTPEIEAQLEIMKTLKKKAEIEDFESPAKYLWESKLLRENY